MIAVKFLQDYRGRLTGEQFYTAGSIAEFDRHVANELVANGRAELVKATKPQPAPKPEPISADLKSLSVAELKALAKESSIDGYQKMRKQQLIRALS